jgi:hypothetical protein
MLKGHSPQMMAQTFGRLSKPLPTLGVIDLNGNCLIQVGFYPKIESGYTLSDILQPQEQIGEGYSLSALAVERIITKQEAKVTPLLPSPSDTTEQKVKGLTLVQVTKFV